MEQPDKTLAARFFFKNCAVSIHIPGELRISRSLKPSPDDVVLNRNFYPENNPSVFIGGHNDFYRFLDLSSPSNSDLLRKLSAIGYLLCNKLPRTGFRCRGFVCVNDEENTCANGKSLFARAIAELNNPAFLSGRINRNRGQFDLRGVDERTSIAILDGISISQANLNRLYLICPGEWRIARRGFQELVIEREHAPYLLITTNTPAHRFLIHGAAIRRFVPLGFSSFFGVENPVHTYFGHSFFSEWDEEQWHLFDNFMFYCVLEYLRSFSSGIDIFQTI